tara:strand:- start:98 stop:304 length:207 start_codon:yes stop_codon:yes gene_type:complete
MDNNYIIYKYNIMKEGIEFISKIGLLIVSIIVFTLLLFLVDKQFSLEPSTKMILLEAYVFIILMYIVI